MALAFTMAGETEKAEQTLINLERAFILSTDQEGVMGLPYTSNHGTNFGAVSLWEHAHTTPAISSTAWYLMAKNGFDPFLMEKNKEIPQEYKFWAGTGVN
jgi:hypothetical protein